MQPLLEISKQVKNKIKPVFTRWARFDQEQVFGICRHVSMKNEIRRNKFLLEVCGNRLASYLDSSRFQTLSRSQECYACGLKGTHLFLETNHSVEAHGADFGYGPAAFNFYAVVEGKLVLMTEDHVVPQSLRGYKRNVEAFQSNFKRLNKINTDDISGFRTAAMCIFCNHAKGNTYSSLEDIREQSSRNREAFLTSQNTQEWLNQPTADAPLTDFWSVFRAKCPVIPKSVKKFIDKLEKETILV